jgi:hypothetical protein
VGPRVLKSSSRAHHSFFIEAFAFIFGLLSDQDRSWIVERGTILLPSHRDVKPLGSSYDGFRSVSPDAFPHP